VGEIQGGKVIVIDKDEAAAHVAPHDKFVLTLGRELGI
jgi:hypothetical protein